MHLTCRKLDRVKAWEVLRTDSQAAVSQGEIMTQADTSQGEIMTQFAEAKVSALAALEIAALCAVIDEAIAVLKIVQNDRDQLHALVQAVQAQHNELHALVNDEQARTEIERRRATQLEIENTQLRLKCARLQRQLNTWSHGNE